jgi:uncharacterized protein (DUF1330 family)
MSAYFLFQNLTVDDAAAFEEYKRRVPETVTRYGGAYRILGGAAQVVEGAGTFAAPDVMIEFPSVEAARAWYQSDDYRPLKAMRLAALRANGLLVEGL